MALRKLQLITFFVAIFLGAFLIFQIQPMVGKIVTPRFGGTSAVWTCCLLFFQLVLLSGYLLTFFLSRLSPRIQAILYGMAFLAAALLTTVKAPDHWAMGDATQPFLSLISILSVNLFVQCLLLSSVSGMIQIWYRLASLGSPYWLYALSNLGSLGALISYPLLIEPRVSLAISIEGWNVGFIVLAFLIAGSSVYVYLRGEHREKEVSSLEGESAQPKPREFLYWCFLTAMTSAALICYTQHLTQDIAPVPLLWVAPLILFLLSYIICFAGDRYCRTLFFLVSAIVLWILEPFLWRFIEWNTAAILALVFCFSMALHSELVKSKPGARYLAVFYLATALGGALGGLFENVAAPLLMNFYGEKLLFFGVMIILFFRVCTRNWLKVGTGGGGLFNVELSGRPRPIVFGGAAFFLLFMTLIGGMIARQMLDPGPQTVVRFRDFYGCVSVERKNGETSLVHGNVIHGTQINKPGEELTPTRYFAPGAGVGYAMKLVRARFAPNSKVLDAAVVGLGSGTFACYGQKGDHILYYEIDPNVIKIARQYFTFLSATASQSEVVLGDGRLALAASKRRFNLIMIDAFNGNAIPVHVLTKEAFQAYLYHLDDDGFILANISNRHVDLEPVLGNLAGYNNLYAATFANAESTWVLVSRRPFPLELYKREPLFNRLAIRRTRTDEGLPLWTDDYTNVFAILNRN